MMLGLGEECTDFNKQYSIDSSENIDGYSEGLRYLINSLMNLQPHKPSIHNP